MCWNFVDPHNLRGVLKHSPETLQKLCVSTTFPHQKIRWNYSILCSVCSRSEKKTRSRCWNVAWLCSKQLKIAEPSTPPSFGVSWNFHPKNLKVILSPLQNYFCNKVTLIQSTIKMKFRQIPMYLITNIWLETSSKSFYDFNEMTTLRDLSSFSSWYLPFLILPYSTFQKNKTLKTWPNWLLSNWSRLLNWKRLGT